MTSFLDELKRRNVLRVAAAYALVSWILIESGSVLLPTVGAPEYVFQIYVLLIFGGFVISLVIAWVFEITPDGVRLEKDLDRKNYKPPARNSVNFVLIGLLVVALVVSISFNMSDLRVANSPLESSLNDLSVAVLPFENRSTDPENGYFADGIQEDLLNRLAGIGSLHVISRTSANEYRNTTKNVSVIGEELGVATIVQGAVQRSGDKIRVTVSLIDARADKQLWAETYNKDASLQDIFELQTEISSQITSALDAALTPEDEQRLAAIPTEHDEAYKLFVVGQVNLSQRRFDTLLKAREQFEQAVKLDPDYARAYAALAETIMVLYTNHQAINPDEARQLAGAALDNALRLDPDNANAYAVRGLIETNQWQRTRTGAGNIRAADDFRRALELNENLSNAYVWFSLLRQEEGDDDGAIEMLAQALEVDPRSRNPLVNLSELYALKSENEASTDVLIKSMEYFPEWELPVRRLSQHLQKLGRLDEAIAWAAEDARISDDPLAGSNALGIFRLFGDSEAITAFMADFPTDHPVSPFGVGLEKFVRDDYQGALDTLATIQAGGIGIQSRVYPLMVRAAILLEDYERAREILRLDSPQLFAEEANVVDRFNLASAVMLAFVEQRLGNSDAANRLLEQALIISATVPRVGFAGHGIRDVQILALQGHTSAALDRLEDAIAEGFVSMMPFDFWTVDADPLIASLRSEPRFLEMRAAVEARIDAMRQTVEAARAADDWSELLSLAGQHLNVAAL
jgi:TolB-like protein